MIGRFDHVEREPIDEMRVKRRERALFCHDIDDDAPFRVRPQPRGPHPFDPRNGGHQLRCFEVAVHWTDDDLARGLSRRDADPFAAVGRGL